MPENQREVEDEEIDGCEREKRDDWAEDQKDRPYYYDDASGYEVYEPENDVDDDLESDPF